MSSERWSRALMSIGGSLGQMANYNAQLERDQANAMREEHLMRLRGQMDKELMQERAKLADARLERQLKAEASMRKEDQAHRERLQAQTTAHQELRMQQQGWREEEARSAAEIASLIKSKDAIYKSMREADLDPDRLDAMDPEKLKPYMAQIDAINRQITAAKYQSAKYLQSMESPKFKEMDDAQIMLWSGYDEQDVEAAKRAAAEARGEVASSDEGRYKPTQRSYEQWMEIEKQNVASGESRMKQRRPADKVAEVHPEPAQQTQPVASRRLMEPIRDEQGNIKYPGRNDAPLLKFGRWLMGPSTSMFGGEPEESPDALLANRQR